MHGIVMRLLLVPVAAVFSDDLVPDEELDRVDAADDGEFLMAVLRL